VPATALSVSPTWSERSQAGIAARSKREGVVAELEALAV
jgi:hypothetical protein